MKNLKTYKKKEINIQGKHVERNNWKEKKMRTTRGNKRKRMGE